jgi:tRNA U34 2-thiouridine synthase MnmA/TrmU
MSGGVDSSVVAALAARSGAEVIGVTLQLYDHGAAVQRTKSCCAGQDIYDAAPSPTGSASPITCSTMKAASGTA